MDSGHTVDLIYCQLPTYMYRYFIMLGNYISIHAYKYLYFVVSSNEVDARFVDYLILYRQENMPVVTKKSRRTYSSVHTSRLVAASTKEF